MMSYDKKDHDLNDVLRGLLTLEEFFQKYADPLVYAIHRNKGIRIT
jgi:hypothetical protein